MPNRIRLDVSCPDCHHSMMDKDHLIEGEPSVLCDIQVPGPNPKLPRKAPIRFSSFYGSSVFSCDVPLENNKRMLLFCPQCESALHGDFNCNRCGEPMVSVDIKGGGRVTLCTKRGCKRHFIELNEHSPGLDKIFDIADRKGDGAVPSPLHAREVKAEFTAEGHKEIISTGSFLATYCPHCRESIIEDDHMIFKVETSTGSVGKFSLSAYLNVFTNESTIELPHADQIKDLRCIHCDHSFLSPEKNCEVCDSGTAMVTVGAMRKLISFYICMKIGCHWHGVSEEDNQLMALEDSVEW